MLLDKTSLEQLYYEYAPRMTAFARRILQDPRQAEDLVQETLLRLWMKRGELGNVRSTEAYGIITLRRIYYDKRRLRHLGIAELNADITDESTTHSDCERQERARRVR